MYLFDDIDRKIKLSLKDNPTIYLGYEEFAIIQKWIDSEFIEYELCKAKVKMKYKGCDVILVDEISYLEVG